MSEQSTLNWQDNYSYNYDISIRNEYTRFACMFYSFTLFAFFITLFLFIFANDSYHNESESIQRRFIAYSVLGSISFALFFIFFIGSLVYTSKFIKKSRLKQTSILSKPIPRQIENPPRLTKQKSVESFVMNTDDSYYTSTKTLAEQKSRPITNSCQTDV